MQIVALLFCARDFAVVAVVVALYVEAIQLRRLPCHHLEVTQFCLLFRHAAASHVCLLYNNSCPFSVDLLALCKSCLLLDCELVIWVILMHWYVSQFILVAVGQGAVYVKNNMLFQLCNCCPTVLHNVPLVPLKS